MSHRLTGLLAAATLVASGLAATTPARATDTPDVPSDPAARVSPDGRTYYVDPVPTRPSGARTSPPINPRARVSASTVPARSSLPGSRRTIFLDFDGIDATGSAWAPGVTGWQEGFDFEGGPGFTAAEQSVITETWQRVSEFYAPFDVNVTTVDPGAAAINRTSSADQNFGIRIAMTSDPDPLNAICQGACAGAAFINVFNGPGTNEYRIGWVFAGPNFNMANLLAHSAAHEAGHTLGLEHYDMAGDTDQGYYFGTSVWGPLMGGGSGSAVVQFSNGDFPNAMNNVQPNALGFNTAKQDDLATIARNGLSYRADIGGTTGTARDLGSANVYTYTGQINNRSDVDAVKFAHACNTAITVSARGATHGQTLDIGLRLLDGSGRLIAAADPDAVPGGAFSAAGMDASLRVAPTRGPYYATVDGVAAGVSPKGWSDYGSVGTYTLNISGCMTRPGRVPLRTASSGARGGKVTATARWNTAAANGARITYYRVRATKLNNRNRPVRQVWSAKLRPAQRSLVMRLPKGRYQFRVQAANSAGTSPWSLASRIVVAR